VRYGAAQQRPKDEKKFNHKACPEGMRGNLNRAMNTKREWMAGFQSAWDRVEKFAQAAKILIDSNAEGAEV
jgi:hypothetical protein